MILVADTRLGNVGNRRYIMGCHGCRHHVIYSGLRSTEYELRFDLDLQLVVSARHVYRLMRAPPVLSPADINTIRYTDLACPACYLYARDICKSDNRQQYCLHRLSYAPQMSR